MNTVNTGLAIIIALLLIGLTSIPVQAEIKGAELLPQDKVQTFVLKSGTVIKGVPIPEKETEYEYRVEVAPGCDIPVKKWELLDLDKVRQGLPVYKEEYEIKALEKKLELIEKSLDDLGTGADNKQGEFINERDRFYSKSSTPYVPQSKTTRYKNYSYEYNKQDSNDSLDQMVNDYLDSGRYFNGRLRYKNSYDYKSDAYNRYGYSDGSSDYYSNSDSYDERYTEESQNYFRNNTSRRMRSSSSYSSSSSSSRSGSSNSLEALVRERLEERNKERNSYFQQNSIRD